MKRSIKISGIIILTLFIALWAWSFSIKSDYLLLGGSTSCNEFMQDATKQYSTKEVIYSSVGSQAGINGAKNKSFAAGFVSKDIDADDVGTNSSKKIDYTNEWTNSLKKTSYDKYYEVSFAKDAIEIIYQPPSWWSDSLNNALSFYLPTDSNPTDSQKIIEKIYENKITWEDLAKEIISEKKLTNVNVPDTMTRFITFTRESGSGTRDSFEEKSQVSDLSKSNVVNSNGLMLQNVSSNTGSIGYVSYSFNSSITKSSSVFNAAINDYKFGNEKNNCQNAMVYNPDKKTFEDSGLSNEQIIKDKYNFTRNYSLLFDTNSNDLSDLKSFINYLLGDDIKNVYTQTGLVQISDIYEFS